MKLTKEERRSLLALVGSAFGLLVFFTAAGEIRKYRDSGFPKSDKTFQLTNASGEYKITANVTVGEPVSDIENAKLLRRDGYEGIAFMAQDNAITSQIYYSKSEGTIALYSAGEEWVTFGRLDRSTNFVFSPTNTYALFKHKPIVVGGTNGTWLVIFQP